jgi:hypothetical protein
VTLPMADPRYSSVVSLGRLIRPKKGISGIIVAVELALN